MKFKSGELFIIRQNSKIMPFSSNSYNYYKNRIGKVYSLDTDTKRSQMLINLIFDNGDFESFYIDELDKLTEREQFLYLMYGSDALTEGD